MDSGQPTQSAVQYIDQLDPSKAQISLSHLQGMLLSLFGPLLLASYDNEPLITLFLLPRNKSNRFANPSGTEHAA